MPVFSQHQRKGAGGDDLLFLVGGKIFVIVGMEPGSKVRICFKCSPERYAELLEVDGAMSAPYVGRFKWIALEHFNVLPERELREAIGKSYELIAAKIPKKRVKIRTRKAARR